MADPLFGSVSQWPAIQVPAFGYFQTPIASSSRPISFIAPGVAAPAANPLIGGANPLIGGMTAVSAPSQLPADPNVFGGVAPTFGGTNFGAGLSAVVANPIGGGMPGFTGADIAVGVTAPALLTAVAMRRGQPVAPAVDQDIEDFIYDALDLLPGTSEVEVRCEAGRCTLTGSVPHKRIKRDVGEIVWAIPTVIDVQNNVTITARRRSRASRGEGETTSPGAAGRKTT